MKKMSKDKKPKKMKKMKCGGKISGKARGGGAATRGTKYTRA